MDVIRIQLLYCHYGWSVAQIAQAVGESQTYIDAVIIEHGWTQSEPQAPALTTTDANGNVDHHGQAIQALKANEVKKQELIAPLAAITEIALLSKITEAIKHIDPEEQGATTQLTNLVKAFKQLTQDSVTTKVVDDASDKPGIAIQVVTQIA